MKKIKLGKSIDLPIKEMFFSPAYGFNHNLNEEVLRIVKPGFKINLDLTWEFVGYSIKKSIL